MPILFTSHQKPTQASMPHLNVTWSAKLSPSPTVSQAEDFPTLLSVLDYTTKIHLEWCLWFKDQYPALFIKLSLQALTGQQREGLET